MFSCTRLFLARTTSLLKDAMIQSSEAPERTIDRSKIAGFCKLGKPRDLGCPRVNPPAHGATRSDGCMGCRLLSTTAAASPGHHDLQLFLSCRATMLHAMGTPHPRLHPPQTCVMHEQVGPWPKIGERCELSLQKRKYWEMAEALKPQEPGYPGSINGRNAANSSTFSCYSPTFQSRSPSLRSNLGLTRRRLCILPSSTGGSYFFRFSIRASEKAAARQHPTRTTEST
jgi:hypothetical protein